MLSLLLLAALAGDVPIDVDGDGTPEVRAAHAWGRFGAEDAPRVLVLVEPRVVSLEDAGGAALRQRLVRHGHDLAREGYRAELWSLEVHRGPEDQDGLTVLGMRRFLQQHSEGLRAAVFVGHFPDAKLVRTCNWRKGGPVTLPGPDGAEVSTGSEGRWLRRIPEVVAHRFDLVLADLDGSWEERYLPGTTRLERIEAILADDADPNVGGACAGLRVRAAEVSDVFHLADGRIEADLDAFSVRIDDGLRDEECSAADRAAQNTLAQPEIAVSRIDARGVAWSPEPRFLDAVGNPCEVAFAEGEALPAWDRVWQPDAALERRLLCEYFDRNHAYRVRGVRPEALRPASIAWGLGSGMGSVRRARAEWGDFDEPGYDVRKGADLRALVGWLQRPALLRTLRAHSNGRHAVFAKTDVAALEADLPGVPWSFTRRGDALVPSLASACRGGRADFFLYRSLWATGALPDDPYFLVHTGCEATSPPHNDRPFDHPAYGARAHAESLLFFTPCLALVGRAKVFYDEPLGFSEALRDGHTFGEAWARYFAAEAAGTWGKARGDIGRKRSYFWSVLGDATLRLPAEGR